MVCFSFDLTLVAKEVILIVREAIPLVNREQLYTKQLY